MPYRLWCEAGWLMPYVSPTFNDLPSPTSSIASLSYSSLTELLTPASSTTPSPTQSSVHGHHQKSLSDQPPSMLALSLGVDTHADQHHVESPPIMMFPRRSASSTGTHHLHLNGSSSSGANGIAKAGSPKYKTKFLFVLVHCFLTVYRDTDDNLSLLLVT